MTDSSPAGRRVLFYSHDGTGLGHLRITLGIASAYAKLRQQDSLLLLTGSLHTSAFALPDNLDYVKLPAMPKRDLYASLPPTEGYRALITAPSASARRSHWRPCRRSTRTWS